MRGVSAVAIVIALGLAGCLSNEASDGDDGGSFDSSDLGFNSEKGPEGEPAAGTPATHGEPDISETKDTPRQEDGRWRATNTVTIDNDFAGLALGDVLIQFAVGDLQVKPSPDGEYHYNLELIGWGATQADAEAARDATKWTHSDEIQDETLALATEVTNEQSNGIICTGIPPLQQCTGSYWEANVVALLPASPSYIFDIGTSTADVTMSGFGGSRLTVQTTTGDLEVSDLQFSNLRLESTTGDREMADIQAGQLDLVATTGDTYGEDIAAISIDMTTSTGDCYLETFEAQSMTALATTGDLGLYDGSVVSLNVESSSGDQSFEITVVEATMRSTTGSITGEFTPTATGDISATATSGDVEFEFPGASNHGYDAEGTTNTGDIEFSITDASFSENTENRKRATTTGFASKEIQTTLVLATSTGDITVEA